MHGHAQLLYNDIRTGSDFHSIYILACEICRVYIYSELHKFMKIINTQNKINSGKKAVMS